MQERQDRPDYPTVDDPSFSSTLSSAEDAGTSVSALEPYIPPNVPHGLPHVVRFATLSSMDLPLEVRFLVIMIARFADVNGVASVANSTLCEICRIGSHHTVERWISLAADVGILRKEPGKGGKDRKSNSYTFLGADRRWAPLPVGQPDINPIVALAQARRIIEELQAKAARVEELQAKAARVEELQAKAARVEELEAELALLRNGHTNGHSEVTNGEDEPPAGPPSDSYETENSGISAETHEPIGQSEVPNGPPESPSETGSHSYENPESDGSQGTHGAIGHSEVPNGPDEGQEYLARRARVEALVLAHRGYYDRSFDRRGVLGAIEFFSRSAENEQELLRQAAILDAGQDPARTSGAAPPPAQGPAPPVNRETGRREVEFCPDCSSPYTTFNGEVRCPGCTGRRRRESEA